MIYDKQLPPMRHLQSLADDTRFPTTREHIINDAISWGFSEDVIDFLKLFVKNEIFESRVDFLTRCEEVEMLIDQEKSMPKEILRSP